MYLYTKDGLFLFQVWLTNLSACNDTHLNGEALAKIRKIRHLDVFTIIDRSFRFEYPSTPKKTPTKSPKKVINTFLRAF